MFSQLYQRLLKADQRPDIIHLQFPYPTGELAWLSSQLLPLPSGQRPKTVLTYHSDIVRQRRLLKFYSPFLRQVLQRVDKILATSPQYIGSSHWLQSVASKCVVAPLGVDYTRFTTVNTEQVAAIKARYGLEQPLVLFAGRLRYYKGLQYLLRAWSQLQHAAKLLIIGIGPMEAAWKAEAAQLGLTSDQVVFLGEISDAELPAYYQAADLFVLPASERSEAFGIVQLEAMAAGCPVITTELGTGTSYVNQNGETGLVVAPCDPSALAAALNQLLTNPTLRQQMGVQAQARIHAKFSIEQMVDQSEAVYQQLVPKTTIVQ
jgi:rhamnosyl/mannosyltransferase